MSWAFDWSSTDADWSTPVNSSLIVTDDVTPAKDSPVNRPRSSTDILFNTPSVFTESLNMLGAET